MMSGIIDIEVTHYTQSGPRYRVHHDGEVLIESCRDPFTSGARALVEKGVTGRIQMRRVGREQIDMEGLIAVAATMTVAEGRDHGPRFARWSPHWASQQEA